MIGFRATALLIGLGLVASTGAVAAPRIDPAEPGLGERADLILDEAPADSLSWPQGFGTRIEATTDPIVFRVTPIRVGEVGVAFAGTEDTLAWTVAGSIDNPASEGLSPLRSQGDVGPVWWPHLILAALLLAGLVLALYQRVRRRQAPVEVYEPPAEPPHLRALRRLDEMSRSGWLVEGNFERWYVEGSHTLREYLGGRYRVPALDWTSGELLKRLVDAGFERRDLESIDPLLHQADDVKFAARRPTEHQAQEWWRQIRGFVEATALERVYSTPEALAAARRMNEGLVR